MDKDKLIIKKQMQEARNILRTLNGLTVSYMFELGEGKISQIDFQKMGVIGGFKIADAVIDYDVSEQWICDFLRARTGIVEGNTIYLILQNGIWVKAVVNDVNLLVSSYLNSKYSNCFRFSFIDSNLRKMYEICCDSRDEYHKLYDEYSVVFYNMNTN